MGFCHCFRSWKRRTKLRRDVCGDDDEEDGDRGCAAPARGNDFALDGAVESGLWSPRSVRAELKKEVHVKARIFNFRELATATRDFREESFIGQGGFGTVYRGRLMDNGQEVAVKRLNKAGHQGEKEFSVEVLMLSLLRHRNLVNLIGYCEEGEQRLLVYEYMPLGSLEDYLHDHRGAEPLDWDTRMKIATGAARGLNYLHNEAEQPVIYRDLKSSNILLDEGFHPKLSDFGLAKFGPVGDRTHVSTRVMGTRGYCAPEYGLSGKLTMKTDVYSFGVVLLELITGHKAVELVDGHVKYLVEWARPRIKDRQNLTQLADPKLCGQFSENILRRVLNIASMCIREDPGSRPSTVEVMLALDYLARKKFNPGAPSIARVKKDDDVGSSPKETTTLVTEYEREQAVAEAKKWGEMWREKRVEIMDNVTDPLDSEQILCRAWTKAEHRKPGKYVCSDQHSESS
ncbi:hypothetical protein MLD38_022740 [Melastoma candidum]|uniref:Uncharacterized protein n=1 Tax=Melastoma candidum TaxID=119954 RepID=A0ACB9QJM1_9MYRT|nr:hypothetical protein MLD38_022740 [Melastoma candidum]